MSVRHRLKEGDIFFLLAAVAMLLFLYVVKVKVGTVTAIKGMYSLCGLLLAAGVYFRYSIYDTTLKKATGQGQTNGIKLMIVLASLSLTITALTGDKLLGLLVLLPLGYGLLAWQIINGVPTKRLLAQTLLLFSLPPIFEYLTSGFYFGNGDIFKHVLWVNKLVATNQLSSISSVSALSRPPSFDWVSEYYYWHTNIRYVHTCWHTFVCGSDSCRLPHCICLVRHATSTNPRGHRSDDALHDIFLCDLFLPGVAGGRFDFEHPLDLSLCECLLRIQETKRHRVNSWLGGYNHSPPDDRSVRSHSGIVCAWDHTVTIYPINQ